MSFFLEAKRNTDFPVQNSPSPFDYTVSKDRKKSHSYAPFNSTTKLNRTSKKQNKQQQRSKQFEDEKVFIIDDANIQVIAQQRMSSIFKSRSQRIIYNHNGNIPGPGSYDIRSKYKILKGKKIQQNHYSVYEDPNKKVNTPSIPTDSLGYKFTQQHTFEKVQKKQQVIPVPGTYQVAKNMLNNKGLSWSANNTTSKKQKEQALPGPGSYNIKLSQRKTAPTSCFNSQSNRFNPKKIRKSYIPGPGQYDPDQKIPIRTFSQSHFNSKSSRFPLEKSISNVGPGSYIKDINSKSLTNFNKKVLEGYREKVQTNRKTIFSVSNNNPGPGQYIAREGMTFQLQKALIRKHNFSQFPNTCREVFEIKDYDEPGPGAYDPKEPKRIEKGNIGYTKVEVVNLKQGQQSSSPSPFDYNPNNFTISSKVQKQLKRLTLTEKKPFNHGEERFLHYTNTPQRVKGQSTNLNYETAMESINGEQTLLSNFQGPKKVKKLIMTSVKVKVPFGSSASKQQEEKSSGLGPGAYNQNRNWIKQTHNIKGKLNKKL